MHRPLPRLAYLPLTLAAPPSPLSRLPQKTYLVKAGHGRAAQGDCRLLIARRAAVVAAAAHAAAAIGVLLRAVQLHEDLDLRPVWKQTNWRTLGGRRR